MTDEIHTADGRTVPVTDDPDAVSGYATGLTVSAKQTASFEDFNNTQPFGSIRVELRPALSLDADGAIDHLRERCTHLRRVVGWHVTNEVERYRESVMEDLRR